MVLAVFGNSNRSELKKKKWGKVVWGPVVIVWGRWLKAGPTVVCIIRESERPRPWTVAGDQILNFKVFSFGLKI